MGTGGGVEWALARQRTACPRFEDLEIGMSACWAVVVQPFMQQALVAILAMTIASGMVCLKAMEEREVFKMAAILLCG